jgi:hypothetical protein
MLPAQILAEGGPCTPIPAASWNVSASTPERNSCILDSGDCDGIDVTLTTAGSEAGAILNDVDCSLPVDWGAPDATDPAGTTPTQNFVDACDFNALGEGVYTISVRSTRNSVEAFDTTPFTVNPAPAPPSVPSLAGGGMGGGSLQ